MINGTAPVSWGTVLADMLDTPVAKLSMRYDINADEDLVDARTLSENPTLALFHPCASRHQHVNA